MTKPKNKYEIIIIIIIIILMGGVGGVITVMPYLHLLAACIAMSITAHTAICIIMLTAQRHIEGIQRLSISSSFRAPE